MFKTPGLISIDISHHAILSEGSFSYTDYYINGLATEVHVSE